MGRARRRNVPAESSQELILKLCVFSVCIGRNSCRNDVSSSRFESGVSHHAVDGLGEALKASTILKLTKELQHKRPLEVLTMDWCITQDKTLQRFDADEVEANAPRIKRARVDLRARWGDQECHTAVIVQKALTGQ